jgi:3-isopropylmalate dehydrogenase
MATILSAKMLLDWLAQKHNDRSAKEGADRIENAVDLILREGGVLPRDLGGASKTNEVGEEIAKKIRCS